MPYTPVLLYYHFLISDLKPRYEINGEYVLSPIFRKRSLQPHIEHTSESFRRECSLHPLYDTSLPIFAPIFLELPKHISCR